MDMEDIEEFVVIDKRIDASDSEGIRDRWDFGKRMLTKRGDGKQLPKGVLDDLVEATGKSRAELYNRMRVAEYYSTEEKLFKIINSFTAWYLVVASLPKENLPPGKRGRGRPPKPKPPPAPNPRRKEWVDLAEQGKTLSEIVEETSGSEDVSEHTVRRELEREAIAREAEERGRAEATILDWDSLPPKVKEREAVIRRQVRRELEREFEPRFQAEVTEQVEAVMKQARRMEADARRILESRKGMFSRSDYDLIRSCLHPDSRNSVSDQKLAKAFRVFNEAEMILLNEKDFPTASGLPSSLDELRKRRRGTA